MEPKEQRVEVIGEPDQDRAEIWRDSGKWVVWLASTGGSAIYFAQAGNLPAAVTLAIIGLAAWVGASRP